MITGGAPFGELCGTEQRTLEWKHAIAISAGSLRKRISASPAGQSFAYRVALVGGAAHSPIDKDATLQFGKPPEEWPLRHLDLGDE